MIAVKQPIWKRVTYRALDVQSHPIDTVEGPQGWGPFDGPYSPRDYLCPQTQMAMSGINVGYNLKTDITDHAPGYHDITVFTDRSTASVNNALEQARNDETVQAGSIYSSTISNTITRAKEVTGQGGNMADMISKLKSAVGG